MDAILTAATGEGRLPGLVGAVATTDGVVYQGAAGLRGVGLADPMRPDMLFALASMTKAVTAIAAMQQVEAGRLSLDQPAGEIVEALRAPMVLDGFDAAGEPCLRPAARPVTLRHLLTHTSGFGYETWNDALLRYTQKTGLPPVRSLRIAALNAPLVFDPGERWEYGISLDWAGRMVEAVTGKSLEAYFQDHIFAPLGITDCSYIQRDEDLVRRAPIHARQPDGSLLALPLLPQGPVEFFPGGGGLIGTASAYLTILRMLLGGGALNGVQVLHRETVRMMSANHIGDLSVPPLRSVLPAFSNDVEFFPGMTKRWGLSFLINTEAAPTGRAAGSLAWGGLFNTYYWLDPARGLAGVLLGQILPFGDREVLRAFAAFETEAYARFG